MKGQARLQLVFSDGKRVRSVNRLARRSPRRRMHDKKLLSGKVLPFLSDCPNHGRPMVLRNALALLPLLDSPMTLTDGLGHLRDGFPTLEYVVDGLHPADCVLDKLSRQERTRPPVTARAPEGTMCPMGSRATTPKSFKEEFARRLRAARELRYEQAADFAKDLGVAPNTYSKYENGRSLLPHHLIPQACALLGVDMKALFEFEKKASKRAA